jgi:hypothetical protein
MAAKRRPNVLHGERIVVLETEMQAVKSDLHQVLAKLDTVLAQQQKYKGFWGAVTLISSAIWAAFTFWMRPNG